MLCFSHFVLISMLSLRVLFYIMMGTCNNLGLLQEPTVGTLMKQRKKKMALPELPLHEIYLYE